MTLALIRLKKDHKKNIFSTVFLLGLLTIPRMGVRRNEFKLFWSFFYFPLEYLMRFLFISEKKIFQCDEETVRHLGFSGDLVSALYKLKHFEESESQSSLADCVLPYFSLCSNQHRSVLRNFLGDEQFADLRYEKLRVHHRSLS